MKNETILSSNERVCNECGKKFTVHSSDLWAYKLSVKGKTIWFCRYNCVRAGEKKLKGRKENVRSKKPSREVLEADLKAGLSHAQIGKKYGAAKITAYNWIRAYKLQVITDAPPVDDLIQTPPLDVMVQESPSLNELEQFHTDELVQELPVVEIDEPLLGMTEEENMTDAEWEANVTEAYKNGAVATEPAPRETFDEIWQDVRDDLKTLERLYIAEAKVKAEIEAKKSFRERLGEMLAEVVGE